MRCYICKFFPQCYSMPSWLFKCKLTAVHSSPDLGSQILLQSRAKVCFFSIFDQQYVHCLSHKTSLNLKQRNLSFKWLFWLVPPWSFYWSDQKKPHPSDPHSSARNCLAMLWKHFFHFYINLSAKLFHCTASHLTLFIVIVLGIFYAFGDEWK